MKIFNANGFAELCVLIPRLTERILLDHCECFYQQHRGAFIAWNAF
jgi:hypothetical protein